MISYKHAYIYTTCRTCTYATVVEPVWVVLVGGAGVVLLLI